MRYRRTKQMLEHLDWADVSAKYAAGWGFKRLADHFTVNRNSMRIALGNRGLVRPYAERTITARAVWRADQMEWRALELEQENEVWTKHELWWRTAYKRQKDHQAEWKRKYAKIKDDADRRERYRMRKRDWKRRNPQKHAASTLAWMSKNPDKVRSYRKKAQAKPENKVLMNLRRRVRDFIKRGRAQSQTHSQLVSCSPHRLVLHIEAQFSAGMGWHNYGQWHVDHIRPCASYDLMDIAQQLACFHYTNLQPLWAKDNMAKGATWNAAA